MCQATLNMPAQLLFISYRLYLCQIVTLKTTLSDRDEAEKGLTRECHVRSWHVACKFIKKGTTEKSAAMMNARWEKIQFKMWRDLKMDMFCNMICKTLYRLEDRYYTTRKTIYCAQELWKVWSETKTHTTYISHLQYMIHYYDTLHLATL